MDDDRQAKSKLKTTSTKYKQQLNSVMEHGAEEESGLQVAEIGDESAETSEKKQATKHVTKRVSKSERRISSSELSSKQHSTPLITTMMSAATAVSSSPRLAQTPSTTKKPLRPSKLNKSDDKSSGHAMKQTNLDMFISKKEAAPKTEAISQTVKENLEEGEEEDEIKKNLKQKKLFVDSDEDSNNEAAENVLHEPRKEVAREETAKEPDHASSRSSSPVSYTAPLSPKKVNSIQDFDDEDFDEAVAKVGAGVVLKEPEEEEKQALLNDKKESDEFLEPKLPSLNAAPAVNNRLEELDTSTDVNMSISSTKAEMSSFVEEMSETNGNNGTEASVKPAKDFEEENGESREFMYRRV